MFNNDSNERFHFSSAYNGESTLYNISEKKLK